VVVGSVVNRGRVIYPLVRVGVGGIGIVIPMEGLALLPFAKLPKLAAIPSSNNYNINNTNGSLLPSLLTFSHLLY